MQKRPVCLLWDPLDAIHALFQGIHKGYFTYQLHGVAIAVNRYLYAPFPAIIANVSKYSSKESFYIIESSRSISVPTTGYRVIERRRSWQMVFSADSYMCSIADLVYRRYVVA